MDSTVAGSVLAHG